MSSSRERFPLREEERRRAWADGASLFAGIDAAALVVSFVVVRLTAGAVVPEFLRVTLPASVPILLVLGAGLWVRLRPRHYVEVDAARGMVTVFRDGEARTEAPPLRDPEQLDLPVHDRLASDEAARTPLPQKAGSRLTVTWNGSGYDITTSWVPPFKRMKILWMFLTPAGILLANFPVLIDLFDPETPALYRGFLVFLVVWVFSWGPYEAVRRWLRIHRPPVIRISPAGFEFRGKTIPLGAIEDVARAPGAVCRVVSDERIVEVEGAFCEPSERDWLRHEIRRLVIEFGARLPAPA